MNHQLIEKKLNDSMIPRHAFTSTLARSGYNVLADITAKKKFINPDNQSRRNYYLESDNTKPGNRAALIATALFAKELRLSGESVCYAPVGVFMRELAAALLPREAQSLSPVMSHIGKGYIVLPDFIGISELSEIYTVREVREFTDVLTHHMDTGGSLVLAGPTFADVPSTAMAHALVYAIEEHFTTMRVG